MCGFRTLSVCALSVRAAALTLTPQNPPVNVKNWWGAYNLTEWLAEAPGRPINSDRIAHGGGNNLCIFKTFVPEFILMGATKASTTSFARDFGQSPDVFFPSIFGQTIKEGHFFHQEYIWNYGLDKLLGAYPTCQRKTRKVATDMSPSYGVGPMVPTTIKLWYGTKASSIKFIAILRDPVERLHSDYYFSKIKLFCPWIQVLPHFSNWIEEIVAGGAGLYVPAPGMPETVGCTNRLAESLYVEQFKLWFREFSPSKFTIVPMLYNIAPGTGGRTSEQLAHNMWKTLGLRPGKLGGRQTHSNSNAHASLEEDLPAGSRLRKRLLNFLEPLAGAATLAGLLAGSGATLYEFSGNKKNVSQIAHWLEENWAVAKLH
jgi:hypothetical protein